ncbi:BgTH12-05959 [Blumeria graminis f. sp. triticale]|uniref:Vacuolar transporter chaperone complex subunit 4 n=3 Tax=Blumeria graminis TaxID=34373 RepID=A0A381LHM0_BLUGR|nr:Vacuolar membrane protein [Blumeria graminis f. sp. tritici 96224]CAD6504226.1 BgTH12-05959 [Blumeria graminis f. sp. triticale]VDB91041.1 Bgt-571 [Blumeria graminis f. sp. tritici]
MKFGDQLRTSVIKEYQWYYIVYDELKDQLKTNFLEQPSKNNPRGKRKPWTEEDETNFLARLESELDKVHTKQKIKAIEISRRIATSEREVGEVTIRLNRHEDAPSEAEFIMLEEDLSDIIADVHDLAKFVQLNYTGFQKIIKKHDKQTSWMLKPVFATRLKAKPFYKDNYDADIIKLSKLYDIVRTRGNPVQGDSSAGGAQGNFIRQTTKYWVHPDNITEVKLIILKHLPVLVFNANKEFDAKDSAITSIYYDNYNTWELYKGRLKKTEGAEAIRMRWYGSMDTETIFVERKTHREDWTGEKSVKARFSLKEKNMNTYLNGTLLPEHIFEKARKDGTKPQRQLDDDERLAKEIQYSILKNNYKPVCRSFYNRTAFQLPADARVRISLDTELTMIREDNLDNCRRAGDNWRRMDIGIDYPFSQLPPEDIERFPYAVLEVKLQTQAGQEPPEWVRELISSHLVEAVPKFSKFIHGTATLFPTRIRLLPYWMPQMQIDIRKPVTQKFGIRRTRHSALSSTSDDDEDEDSDEDSATEDEMAHETRDSCISDHHAHGNSLDTEEIVGLPLVGPEFSIYESDDEDNKVIDMEEARRIGGWTYQLKLLHARASQAILAFLQSFRVSRKRPAQAQARRLVVDSRFKAPSGKKIHVPIRIEPKVYFAAERTYLSWLEYCVYIGYISVTVLNLGSKSRLADFLPALAFITVALLSTIYAMTMYSYRSYAIRHRRAIRYHDRYGTTMLCFVFFVAIMLNFWQQLGDRTGQVTPGILVFGKE